MEYKVGDKVEVRENLNNYEEYDKCMFVPSMKKFLGKIVTIKGNPYENRYTIEEDVCDWYFSPSMFKRLVRREENNMKDFKIVNYKTYEKKAVIVKFDDGTEEKAVCCETDKFDLERGVEVCVLKHLFGADGYKSMLRTVMKQVREIDKATEDKKKDKEAAAKKKAKNDARKARRRENKRKARVEEMKEAYLAAMKEYGNINIEAIIDDDLK